MKKLKMHGFDVVLSPTCPGPEYKSYTKAQLKEISELNQISLEIRQIGDEIREFLATIPKEIIDEIKADPEYQASLKKLEIISKLFSNKYLNCNK